MPLLGRRGFTLVELMIAIVLLGIFATGVYQVLLNNQRTFAAQTQRIDLQQNIRAAATILPGEFRELDAGDSDIVAMDSSSITIRAMRQLAFICDAPVLGGGLGQVSLTVRQTPFFGDRQNFQGGDSVMVFDEGNPGIRRDDQWLHGAVTGSGNLACTDGSPGFQVQLQPQWLQGGVNVNGAITAGAPGRGVVSLTYKVGEAPAGHERYPAQQGGRGAAHAVLGA